jgi:hypothetical protein
MTRIVFTYFVDFDTEVLCGFSFEVHIRNEYFRSEKVVIVAIVKNFLELGQTGGCALY